MFALIAVMAVAVAVAAGILLGWTLRSVTSWCPHCGEGLTCSACERRPGFGAVLNKAPGNPTAITAPSVKGRRA
jgi:hypothetical protein